MKVMPLQPVSQCSLLNQDIHINLFGACKSSDIGNKSVLTITNTFTKYVEIVAIPNKEAETVALSVFRKCICEYGCLAIIHTGNVKEFINKIATEQYQKLNIKGTNRPPAHPKCSSYFNKTLNKFMKNVVDENKLNLELYLAPLLFCYNTSYHFTINLSPFELTYWIKPRLSFPPIPEMERISYKNGFEVENLQILKKSREIALDHSFNVVDFFKSAHDVKASVHNLKEGDYAYL